MSQCGQSHPFPQNTETTTYWIEMPRLGLGCSFQNAPQTLRHTNRLIQATFHHQTVPYNHTERHGSRRKPFIHLIHSAIIC